MDKLWIAKVDTQGLYMFTFCFIDFDARFQREYTVSGKTYSNILYLNFIKDNCITADAAL